MNEHPCCTASIHRMTPAENPTAAPPLHPAATQADAPPPPPTERPLRGQVRIPAGRFLMGDAFDEGYPGDGEVPRHPVRLPSYALDATTVTNAAFSTFVKATGYVTEAERFGSSVVFHLAYRGDGTDVNGPVAGTPWWLDVAGACWRHPDGNRSDVGRRQNHPVVHVTHNDARAFASWAGKRLPSEAEWEYAARGGLEGARFAWGDDLTPRGRWMCNIFQGDFPATNTLEDGYLTTAPVKSFNPNPFGLFQMAGNVWEWCGDWFDATYYQHSPEDDPVGPDSGELRVMRGGSYLCHDSYCNRYRVAARSAAPPSSSAGNLGFRCATTLTA